MSHPQNIPFLDLVTPHVELEQELTAVFHQALRTAGFIGGPMVENFEKDFAAFCDAQFCVGVSSGTDALRFALMAAGVKAGDVVVTVPNTFIATTEAISQAGALPEFIDIDERTYNMDPEKLREYLEVKCSRNADGKLVSPAYVTVFHNGVLVQNHFRLTGETTNRGAPVYKPYREAPIKLQAHGDPSPPISFRNIWVRKLADQ